MPLVHNLIGYHLVEEGRIFSVFTFKDFDALEQEAIAMMEEERWVVEALQAKEAQQRTRSGIAKEEAKHQ